MIRLHTLGALEIVADQGNPPSAVLAHPRKVALLAYLAASVPRLASRDTLSALFWPGAPQAHARGALRQALFGLRRLLGRDVVIAHGDEHLEVNPSQVWLDAAAMEQLVAKRHAGDALQLYHGEFLRGIFLGGGPGFERWLDARRAHYAEVALSAAWSLLEEAERSQKDGTVVHWARWILTLVPNDELATSHLIGALLRIGDRVGALHAFHSHERALAREFGLRPSPATQALIEHLLPRTRPEGPIAAPDRRRRRVS